MEQENQKQTQNQQPNPFLFVQPEIKGVGVVIKKDGSISIAENTDKKETE